jgi:glycosyltransferase involved in cell wall biosynthesis
MINNDFENMDSVVLSIVTVCLNVEKDISKAIESVLKQDYTKFEYIIIDGKSTDKTNEIIEKYKDKFDERKIALRHYSDCDKGVYDAMNKGIALVKGEWISFLNADDYYYDEKVLIRVFGDSVDEYDLIYGGSVNRLGKDKYYRTAKEPETVYYRMPFVHQAAFIRTDVIKKYMFDLKYRYSADFNQFVKVFLDGYRIKKLNYPIVQFNVQGMSGENILSVMKEHELIRFKNGIFYRKLIYRYIRYLGMIGLRSVKGLHVVFIKLMNRFSGE